jgi:hypothetical protein
MSKALLLFALCACGAVPPVGNDYLAGTWHETFNGIDTFRVIRLSAGPNGAFGTGTCAVDCLSAWPISTLPDGRTLRWGSSDGLFTDYDVQFELNGCEGETQVNFDVRKLHRIHLRRVGGTDPYPLVEDDFVRDTPAPLCSTVAPPAGDPP